MFPLHDDNPGHSLPLVTFLIIALNVLAWAFLQGFGTEPALSRSVCLFGLIPGELLARLRPGTSIAVGGDVACMISQPNWLTPITSMFMHGSWFHIIGNMWFLGVFGDNVEDSMSHARFITFYLICGLAAVAAQMAANPASPVPMVGASGAIGGVMGAYAMLYPRARVHMLIFLGFYISRAVVPAALMLGYWFFIQLIAGTTSLGGEGGGVAFWAHAGGFLAGMVLCFLFRDSERVAAHKRAIARSWGERYV